MCLLRFRSRNQLLKYLVSELFGASRIGTEAVMEAVMLGRPSGLDHNEREVEDERNIECVYGGVEALASL